MNKVELIRVIAEEADISKTAAEHALSSVIDSITGELKQGRSVSLAGFGTFSVRERAARVGRNPSTGEQINIKASKAAAFKAGKALKEALNQHG